MIWGTIFDIVNKYPIKWIKAMRWNLFFTNLGF